MKITSSRFTLLMVNKLCAQLVITDWIQLVVGSGVMLSNVGGVHPCESIIENLDTIVAFQIVYKTKEMIAKTIYM